MRPPSVRKNVGLKLLIGCCLFVCGCASEQPTPEAARGLLKMRGYEFDERSFLSAAARSDLFAVSNFLIAGINPNAKDENGNTALMKASATGDMAIVDALLHGGADVNTKAEHGLTALVYALENDRDEVVSKLCSQPKIDLEIEAPPGRMTALMIAVWRQREGSVKQLLKAGAQVSHQDKDGDTAVHGAALDGNAKILQMLLDANANPNVKNKLGGTALMWAASNGRDEIVRVLLDKGADPRLKDVGGLSAADWAAKNKQEDVAMLLHEAEKRR